MTILRSMCVLAVLVGFGVTEALAQVSEADRRAEQERTLQKLCERMGEVGIENMGPKGLSELRSLLWLARSSEVEARLADDLAGLIDARLDQFNEALGVDQAETETMDAWTALLEKGIPNATDEELKAELEKAMLLAELQSVGGPLDEQETIWLQGPAAVELRERMGEQGFLEWEEKVRGRAREEVRSRLAKLPKTWEPRRHPKPGADASEPVVRGPETSPWAEFIDSLHYGSKPPDSAQNPPGTSEPPAMTNEDAASMEQAYLLYLLEGTGPEAEAWRRELATAMFGLTHADQFQAGDLGQSSMLNTNAPGNDTVITVGGDVFVEPWGVLDRWNLNFFPAGSFFGRDFSGGLVQLYYPVGDPAWQTLPGNGSNANVTLTGSEVVPFVQDTWRVQSPSVQVEGDGTHTDPAATIFLFE